MEYVNPIAYTRYWVSLVWTESEPVAQGIKPLIGRKWFKRVKVRFDWVQSQGQPWWERSAGPAPTEACQPNEIILSSQAKRISVSALSNGWDQDRLISSVSRPTYTRRSSVETDCSSISTSSGRDFVEEQIVFSTDKTNTRCSNRRRHSSRAESDASSALTPLPETPPSTCLELPVIIGFDITESNMPMAPRLPGDYCLAVFEDEIVTEDDGRPLYVVSCPHIVYRWLIAKVPRYINTADRATNRAPRSTRKAGSA